MLKKIAVGLVILVALGIAGFGIYGLLGGQRFQTAGTKPQKNVVEEIDLSKLPELKLIAKYEYPYEIQQGGVIFHEGTHVPKIVSTEKELIFQDKNGKITKRRKMKLYESVRISENGKYFAWEQGTGVMGIPHPFRYTDENEKVLFEREVSMENLDMSPNGDYLVRVPYDARSGIEFIDKNGKTIKKYNVRGGLTTLFSKDGKYCWNIAGGAKEFSVRLFKKQGRELVLDEKIEIKEKGKHHISSEDISNDGHTIVLGGYVYGGRFPNTFRTTKLYGFDLDGLVFEKTGIGNKIIISADGKYILAYKGMVDDTTYPLDTFTLFNGEGVRMKQFEINAKDIEGYDKYIHLGGLKYDEIIGKDNFVFSVDVTDSLGYLILAKDDEKKYIKKLSDDKAGFSGFIDQNMYLHEGIIIVEGARKILVFRGDR